MRSPLVIGGIAALGAMAAGPVTADHKPGHAKPPGKGNPTIAATPNPVVFGRTTTVAGRLKGTDNAGKTVTLQAAPHPFTTFELALATTTTDANGDYSFVRRPKLNTVYRTLVEGKQSPDLTVSVALRVSLSLSDRTPRRGQRVRFSGRACPAHDGEAVRLQRRNRAGAWATVRRNRLRAATRCSAYRTRLRVFRDGRFRAVVDGDADHVAGVSPARRANAPG